MSQQESESSRVEVTTLLHAWSRGDQAAFDKLAPIIYTELLLDALRDPDQDVRWRAAYALGHMEQLGVRLFHAERELATVRWAAELAQPSTANS